MKNKILGGFLAACMIACTVSLPSFAESEKIVIYENDFSGATVSEALPAFSNDYVSFGGYDKIEGNQPLLVDGALRARGTGNHINGRTLLFDFTKGGTSEGITTGVLAVGFDIVLTKNTNNIPTANFGMNMTNYYTGGIMGGFLSDNICTKNTISQYNASDNPVKMELGKSYHVDILMDAEKKTPAIYLDGMKLKGATVIPDGMIPIKTFTITFGGTIWAFDNLKIEKWEGTDEFFAEVKDATVSGIEIETTSNVYSWNDFAEDIVIKRNFDGKILEADVIIESLTKAKIVAEEGFEEGYSYEVILPDYIESFRKEQFEFENKTINVDFAKENSAKSIRLKNYSGDVLPVEDKNPAELQSVVIEFTEDVYVNAVMHNVEITDNTGKPVEFDIKTDANFGEAVFKGALKGNTKYTVRIFELNVLYVIEFETAEGMLCVKSLKLYDADGNPITKLSEINANDNVKALAEIANTSGEDLSYLATVTMQNGKLLTGMDFENGTVLSGTKNNLEFEFKVSDLKELSFGTLLWHPTQTAPLAEPVYLTLN